MSNYTLYLVRSNTPEGFTSSQQFKTMESAFVYARAHAIKWTIRCNDEVVAQGSRK